MVAREPDADPAADAARRDAAISLHHVHLPLLADFGLVEYDAGENVVRG
ncbi:DUF7344 domain-containing protein [Halobaculum litoreum]|uniref:DUF7344 domain-containing protein n=1 Tax=Halobaculum litoreum TaxID=3031998 RepID=A0ABD5XQV6_9EURY|nr:hypothetical protein [Halobaculum sp. DT92]